MSEWNLPDSGDILRTKLYPPQITADMVSRVALLERLEREKQRPITLISAPAGYGKSVLASMWLTASGLQGGWVSLDESDNDLYSFARYLLAAMETALPQASLPVDVLLSSSLSASPATIAHYLLRHIDKLEAPFLLILDDIHRIREQKIFTFLEALLNHPSPVLHVVLVGRQDPPLPIASWRAYGHITEIRLRDLRFTSPETAAYLSKVLQDNISESMADEWTDKTEGWIVALRLAVLSLRYRNLPSDVAVDELADNQFLHEYLLTELLAQLPETLRNCLLNTALLDRFCAPLCEAVCWEHDDGSEQFDGVQYVEWLRESNLFVVSLDHKNEWFRFHHLIQSDLQQMLRSQLSREEIAGVHRRASQWFADNGWVAEAIRHALAADDTAMALQTFAANRTGAMNGERWPQLELWVRLFPEEVVESDPLLLLTRAHLPLAYGFDFDLETLLTQAGSLLSSSPADAPATSELWAELTYYTGLEAIMKGPASGAIDAGAMMRATLPPDAHYLRGQALALEAFGHQMAGNIEQGTRVFQEALTVDHLPVNLQIKACLNQALPHFIDGDLVTAQIFAEKSVALAAKYNLDASAARCFAGSAYYLQDDLTQAEACLLPTMSHLTWVDPIMLAHSACTLMRMYYDQGKAEQARAIAHQARAQLEEQDNAYALQLLDMFQGELALEQGDIVHARQLILPLNVSPQLPIWFWHYYVPQLTPVKLWLAEGRNVERALTLLTEMDDFLRNINRNLHRIDILALQALAYKALNNWPKALDKLAQSVGLAARGGLIRNYLNLGPQMRELMTQLDEQWNHNSGYDSSYVVRILDAFSADDSTQAQGASPSFISIDALTGREREILNLLATDLSTKEIAEELNISWSTARTHIKNIYGKLEAHSRYEAVLRAKEYELL